MKKILFICSGNTCRSPMAQAIYENLTGEPSASAGLGAQVGDRMSPNAVLALEALGITGFSHTATPVTVEMVNEADEIYCMGNTHKLILSSAVPSAAGKIFMLDPKGSDVSDPYGGTAERYEKCAVDIKSLIYERFGK